MLGLMMLKQVRKCQQIFMQNKVHGYLWKRRKVMSESYQKVMYNQLLEGHSFR